MRDMKFRAYDKKNKSWIYSSHQSNKNTGWFWDLVDKYDCEVMQFIGLPDKNDKEIWEGDIIKVANGDVCVIEFVDAAFLATVVIGKWNFRTYNFYYRTGEVIGNIYDNPELLEGKECSSSQKP